MKPYLVLAAVLLVVACSARSNAGVAHFARGVGQGSELDISERTARVFALYQFEIEREEAAPNLFVETRWRERMPFEDERSMGISAAQIRAIMRARPRSTTSAMGVVYSADLTVEQRVRTAGSEWISLTATPEARAYAARLAEDLRRELDVGVRRF